MRQITSDSINAFDNSKMFNKQNMSVYVEAEHTTLSLHGNDIARRYKDGRTVITNCGWLTPTTKERLNAIDGVHLYRYKGVWYLGDTEVTRDSKYIWNGAAVLLLPNSDWMYVNAEDGSDQYYLPWDLNRALEYYNKCQANNMTGFEGTLDQLNDIKI